MKETLHIIKNSNTSLALGLIAGQITNASDPIKIVLIQKAVQLNPKTSLPVFVLGEDLKDRESFSTFPTINYRTLIEMIFAADRVMTW